jgi:hypothetical protein
MVDAVVEFPAYGNQAVPVQLVVDTGAARTVLSSGVAIHLARLVGISAGEIGTPYPMFGVGGNAMCSTVRATLHLLRDDQSPWARSLDLLLLEPGGDNARIPSLLGTDILREIAVLVDIPNNAVVFYD